MLCNIMNKKIYSAANLQEAEILKSQLERAGIPSMVIGGDLAVARGELPLGSETDPGLWVEHQYEETARLFIAKLLEQDSEPDSDWTCPKCHELVEGNFLTCWNCGGYVNWVWRQF